MTMRKALLAVDGSRASRLAARHVVLAIKSTGLPEVHLLNVQVPLRRHVAQFLARRDRDDFYRDESERALRGVRRMLDSAAVPYSVHAKVGPPAELIAATAAALGCDHIVIGSVRKSALLRALESSVASRVLELAHVPVVVIAGEKVSSAERYGVPAGVGAALALLLYATAD
jgi:nucleotide-binding universal stress UspA family protein